MTKIFAIIIALALLLLTAPRLPAPIQEVPESPTPKPEQSAKPKQPKARATETPPKAKPTPKPSPTPARPVFAGTWRGILTGSANGATATIVVSPGEDSAVVTGLAVWKERRGRTTISGRSISWKFLAESWVMTVAPDGQTATVTGHHWPAGTSTGTLERVR